MSKAILVTVLPLGVFLGSLNSGASKSDLEAIKQAALDYGQGWYEGNAERMERALHPDLAKRVLMPDPRSGKGKIDHLSALGLVQAVRKGWGTKTPPNERRTEVAVLDVYGNAASVKLEMHDWIDYMHLSKIGGRWVIVNVLWEMTPEAKKKHGIPVEL